MSQKKSLSLTAVIGTEDTVAGFLLAGVGELDKAKNPNFMIVEKDTTADEIEKSFNTFLNRPDVAVILINQHIAEEIRYVIEKHTKPVPAVLEIPSKETHYNPDKDSILIRAKSIFGGDV